MLGASLALLIVGGDAVYADQVDDLLAGKLVEIDTSLAQEPVAKPAAGDDASPSALPLNRSEMPASQPAAPQNALSQSWELTLADPEPIRQAEIAPQAGSEENRPAAPEGVISLVPEPSAIALAAAALAYFLIFFRRRYSF